ncbi:DUF1553 domain-containing protein [Persicitalea jodogahamensis]|uniref:DUF1553 domain-containing protein n=1 Tax=Persicitalea jodogahamensis TaxID=402147 RepID=A0A8J3DB90_9BACT|nr:DUF1553 domain-containing protein [Persicitalea jodogahamensis]GHB77612.1 hypothetical protein GCM10007390_34730 [Persicitalea jodogahamensis]
MKTIFQASGVLLALLCFSCSPDLPDEVQQAYNLLPSDLDFNYDVKPILSDKCFACHGPDAKKRKADLRLDIAEEAYRALGKAKDYHAIVPGNSAKSTAVERILSHDPEMVMPTPESHLSLTVQEKAILVKWIEEGAEYQPHWSFMKPEKGNAPRVKDRDWPKNPIDNYVLDKLEAKGIEPADVATRETLIRRASFDLCGLPPTLAEIDRFVADESPDAYEKMIDRYLASPAYGERMAVDWMDVARYTDSDGYLDDKHREVSPWRDWVIQAFNKNMSYRQFVTWQLAGDLIENKTKESVLATAFNRLHRRNSEAGIIYEEYRVEYVADRANTLGKAFLGLSVECARCHDHKYDPISQKDYYRMFGFFNSTNEIGTAVYGPDQTPGPSLLLTSDKNESVINFIKDKIEDSEQKLNRLQKVIPVKKDAKAILADLNQELDRSTVAHYPFNSVSPVKDKVFRTAEVKSAANALEIKEPLLKPGRRGNALFINEFTTAALPNNLGWYDHTVPFSTSLSVFPDTLYKDVSVFVHAEDDRLGMKGYSLLLKDNKPRFVIAHSWPQNAIEVVAKRPLAIKKWSDVSITYDGSGRADGVHIYVNGLPIAVEVLGKEVYKSILFEPNIHTYGFRGLQLGVVGRIITFENGGIDELRLFDKELSALEVLHLYSPKASSKAIAIKPGLVTDHYALQRKIQNPAYREVRFWRDSLTQVLDRIPEIMVMGDLPKPRKTFVLNRGVYDSPTDEVQPAALSSVLPYTEKYPKNRLGLTQWLFDEENPLTARVIVNRIWAMHFGNGLVKTPDDFGNQGELPTNPGLLDYLAVSFVESGWDMKQLHKQIMLSATYQQSSVIRPDLYEKDPENVWLARGPSFRLSAEMIRDNALAVSGLLVQKQGGKSVYPYQPPGLWDEISNKSWRYKYLQESGEGLYRRSLYTVWKRTSPPPTMMIFDATDRTFCTVKRRSTSTPLQALVLLNDPQMIEAARVLAEKIKMTEPTAEKQLRVAFRTLLGRQPDSKEKKMMGDFYKSQKEKYARRKEDAIAYLETGDSERNQNLNPAETAALAFVINGLMNTSEGYSRN